MIPLKEYASRRSKILKSLKGAAGIIFAGDSDHELGTTWRSHAHFEYVTGITNEPGGVLLFDPTNPVEARRVILFLHSRDPELEQWDGIRKPLGSELRNDTGITTILRTRSLQSCLKTLLQE